MEEKYFTASIELNRKTMFEFYHTHGPLWQRVLFFALVPVGILILVGSRLGSFPCWIYLIGILIQYLRMYRAVERMTAGNNGRPIYNKITVTDQGFRFFNPDSGNEKLSGFGEFQGAWRSKNHLYLVRDQKQGRLIDLHSVAGGTPEELMVFIREHSPHWKQRNIPKRWDRRIPGGVIAVIAMIVILTSTGGAYSGSTRTMDAREAAEVLTDLGITGITEEMILEVQKYEEQYSLYNGYNCVTDFLYLAGCGEYDPETWEWTPAESGVYTFDMEAWELSMMYTDFLVGVAAMSGGELEFTDIVEDDSDVNWEEGTGTKTVSFTFRGERYTLQARMLYDWYDTKFLNEFSRTINRTGEGKKLFYLYDGYQMFSVFYEDASWARQFRKMTGYSLVTEMPD